MGRLTVEERGAWPCKGVARATVARRVAWPAQALLAVLLVAPVFADDLAPLLAVPGTTVTLDGSTLYTITEYPLTVDKTLECNGAQITSTGGPIRVSGTGVRLVIDNCRISGSGWALLGALSGAQLVVQNGTQLTGNGANSAIYLSASSLDMTGGSIDGCMWGVNMENADAALHGVDITGTIFAVQNVAGAVTLDSGCSLTNLDPVNTGTGVALIPSATYPSRAATGVLRDSTFVGFGNAVDIQPTAAQGLPPGTVEIVGCAFDAQVFSSLSAVDAENVRMARSRVTNAKADGVFLMNSTGVIEDSEILDSLNTGMSFFGCPNGATIRNSLVSGSVHQGVAIGVDPGNDRVSHGVQVIDCTIRDNIIANLLVDERSDAVLQGNIFSGAPDASVRFHGSPSVRMISGLLLDSLGGLEIKDSANASTALSAATGHDRYGALVYANATATFSHCAFEANGLDPVAADYSVFANTGAEVTLGRCALGPAGARALYNNAGGTLSAANTFWSHASGPQLLSGGGGSGALLGWNTSNGSTVSYEPAAGSPTVGLQVNRALPLAASTTALWEPDQSFGLTLVGASGIVAVPGGVVAALRLHDAATLTAPRPPTGTFSDGVVAVWIDYDLLSRSASGELRFRTTGAGAAANLYRLAVDGTWTPLAATWDAAASQIVYAPSDPRGLHGVFAFGDGVPVVPCATARECLEAPMAGPLCAEALNPKLQKIIGKKMRGARTRLTAAAGTTNPRKMAKLTRRARGLLEAVNKLAAKFVQVKRDPISAICRDAIIEALRPALERLDAGAL